MEAAALAVRERYGAFEERSYGRRWTPEELTLGFVGDVGDLVQLVQSKAGVRAIDDVDAKLAHELADCLWSVICLARAYDIDLEAAFGDTMGLLDEWLTDKGV